MPSFQTMFEASKGKAILYQGKQLLLIDYFPTLGFSKLRLVFEACNSTWRQGVALRIRDEGQLSINGHQMSDAVCWQDSAPSVVEIELRNANSVVVYNVWDIGNGSTDSWHNGAAMIVEEVPNGRRYRCNDGAADDDFDDIVFRLERSDCRSYAAAN